jgi:putative endonuclease
MASLYIIYSLQLDRYYVGITHIGAEERLLKHNVYKYSGKNFTAKANDWQIKLEIVAQDNAHARRMELYVKKMKSRKYLELLISSELEREKLFMKHKSI